MDWMTTDVGLLESDVKQIRQHLGWLIDDLRIHRAGLGDEAASLEEIAADVADCLARLGHLDSVLRRVRETVK